MLQDNGLNYTLRVQLLYMLIILFMSPSDRYVILEKSWNKEVNENKSDRVRSDLVTSGIYANAFHWRR